MWPLGHYRTGGIFMRLKKPLALLLVVLMLLLSGCEIFGISVGGAGRAASIDTEQLDAGVLAGNTHFAFDLAKILQAEDPDASLFLSPLSISTALAMTYHGARSTTKETMEKALSYEGISAEAIGQTYQALLPYLEQIDPKVEIAIANSIWAREGKEIQQDFLDLNKAYYYTEVTTLDFSKDSAADTINGWIEDATKGKIERMLEPPIQPNVVLYLINAIYFKGKWTTPFDKDNTRDGTFTSSQGEQQTVPMMDRKDTIEYFEGDSYKAVRLPYGEGRLSMVCILPSEGTNLSAFLEGMNEMKWEEIRAGLSETEDVILQIPRFKLEYGIKELNDSLISLGMEEAFSDQADFSGIRDGIFINRVLHKAVIEVNEQGSEAAGATVVEMTESAAMDPITFVADRPFLFLIVDDTTGTILFLGTLQEIPN